MLKEIRPGWPPKEIGKLLSTLETSGLTVPISELKEKDQKSYEVIRSWGSREEVSPSQLENLLNNIFTEEGQEFVKERDLDLKYPLGLFDALGIVPELAEHEEIIVERGEIFPPTERSVQSKAITPIGGYFLERLLATPNLVLDSQVRQMTVEAVREWLEMGLAKIRSQNDQEKASALEKQATAVEKSLSNLLGKPVDLEIVFENGLDQYYQSQKTPKESQFKLSTPQGMAVAIGEVYPELAAAILAAPEVAGEKADGIVARTNENERKRLAITIENNERELEEIKEENRRILEGLKIENNNELAALYNDASPALKEQAEISRDLKAIEAATWVATLRETLKELSRVPMAVLGGPLEQIREEASKNKPVAVGGVLGLSAGGVAVLYFGLPWPIGLGIAGGSLVAGALVGGLLTPKKEKQWQRAEG